MSREAEKYELRSCGAQKTEMTVLANAINKLPGHRRPDQTRPDQTRPDQTISFLSLLPDNEIGSVFFRTVGTLILDLRK
jgi:hypothetical protein